jgi:hypothetical protein
LQPPVETALNDIISKFGSDALFQPAGYDTIISFGSSVIAAPAIELAAPDSFTPGSSIICRSVIGPFPVAPSLYEYETISPATAWFGCIYAYAAGVDVDVVVIEGVTVGVTV